MKERMSKKDLNAMIKEADSDNDGFINCHGNNPKKLLHRIFFGCFRVLLHSLHRGDHVKQGQEEEQEQCKQD